MRSVSQIYSEIVTTRNNYLQLTELNSGRTNSKLSMMNLITYVTAVCIHTYEAVLDVFQLKIAEILNGRINGTPDWYVMTAKKFQYNPLMRVPPKPARIRGRFTDADFFFEEKETEAPAAPKEKEAPPAQKPLISDGLSQFADLWEDDAEIPEQPEPAAETEKASEQASDASKSPGTTEPSAEPDEPQEEPCDEM